MNIDQVLQTFITECRELLGDMEIALLESQRQEVNADAVNAIFRAIHTIGLWRSDVLCFFHCDWIST